MPTLKANGVVLYYEVYGDGVPILGIHGSPGSALAWAAAAHHLARYGRCIVYDRRGFFRSERPVPFETVDLADHVGDAIGLLDALSATPAVLLGSSTGGQIAVALALRHPELVRALVLLEPAVFTLHPDATAWGDRLRRTLLGLAPDNRAAAAEMVIRAALSDADWEAMPPEFQELFAESSPAVLAEMRGEGLDLSAHPFDPSAAELASIAQPTLVVAAEESPVGLRRAGESLAAALPHAECLLVAGGHQIDPAHPAILDFLGRI